MHRGQKTIDDTLAAEMIRSGESIRSVADEFRVSPQSIYSAIRAGRLPSPARAQHGTGAA